MDLETLISRAMIVADIRQSLTEAQADLTQRIVDMRLADTDALPKLRQAFHELERAFNRVER